MSTNHKPLPDEVEHLLRNAELRDELEPYFDESIRSVNVEELPTPVENEFLASMLAWERAPVLPIGQWFEPELTLPQPDTLDDDRVARAAVGDDPQVVRAADRARLHRSPLGPRVVLPDLSRHSALLARRRSTRRRTICTGTAPTWAATPTTWLRYYATPEERRAWAEDFGEPLPEAEEPPYPRQLPRRPL